MTAAADTTDPYAALALVYDDWQARYGSFAAAVLDRLLPVLDAEVPAVASFFEAGCGTGALLLELAARRPEWRLAGADVSASMLACARAKSGADRIAWHETALGAPIPAGPFDAAGCFFNTLNHLRGVPELRAAFAALAAALRPNALLLFDVNNRTGYERWWRERNVYEGPGWRMESDARFDGSRNEAQALLTVNRDGVTAEVMLRERLFEDAEITAALADSGLRPISREPWSPTPDGAPGSTLWMARRIPSRRFSRLGFSPGGKEDGEHHDGPRGDSEMGGSAGRVSGAREADRRRRRPRYPAHRLPWLLGAAVAGVDRLG